MKMLALEFSTMQRSVAVTETAAAGESRLLAESIAAVDGSAGPLKLIDQALTRAQVRRGEIEGIVIGLGPGSYTGIRMAIATARGWKLGLDVALSGLNSAETMAWEAWTRGVRGSVCMAIDAQRGDFHLGRFELSESECRWVEPMEILPGNAVDELIKSGVRVFAPESPVRIAGAESCFPTARALADLFVRGPGARIAVVEPIYLRPASFVKAPQGISVPGL